MKQKSVDLKILLLFILKKNACRLYFLCMSKHKAKKLTTNSNLIDKMGILWMIMMMIIIMRMKMRMWMWMRMR